jgi:taurine transport system permease protein
LSKKPVFLSLILLVALWSAASLAVNRPLLPAPWSVAEAFFVALPQGLGWHIFVSLWRILLGMAIATLLGVPLGLWLGQNRQWDKYVYPLVYTTYPIPKIVLLPVIILFLGIGDVSKVFLIALILFFQVLVIVRDGSRNLPAEYVLSLRSVGANRWQILRHVYLPACLPTSLTALRLNVAVSIAVLYLAESFATRSGLGYYIMDSWQRLAYTDMYAGVLAMSLVGALMFVGLGMAESRLCRWTQVGKAKS